MRTTGVGIVALVSLLTACSAPRAPGPAAPPLPVSAGVTITLQSVPLIAGRQPPEAIGNFTFVQGLELTSADSTRLHGLSDLDIDSDGTFRFVSDDGDLIETRSRRNPDGTLAELAPASITRLRGLEGQPLEGKVLADAEGLARWPNGDLMVSFERQHRIWRYAAADRPPIAVAAPEVVGDPNNGIEALSIAPGAGPEAWWAGTEGGEVSICRSSTGCQIQPDAPAPPSGLRLTAIHESPDGLIGFLHHQFRPGIGSRISLSLARRIEGRLDVIDRLDLASPQTLDNFEGLSIQPGPGGTHLLYLISDDNFSSRQRTLLFVFKWHPSPNRPDRTVRPAG